MRTWLVIDCQNIAYRAYHALPFMVHEGKPTSVIFGFFQTLLGMMDRCGTPYVAFCFDRGQSRRRLLSDTYRAARRLKHRSLCGKEERTEVHRQIRLLRDHYLPALGFHNIFSADGYEADDLIASVVRNRPAGDHVVMVSSDHDLYQLLDENVSMWLPGKKAYYTPANLYEEFGVNPGVWNKVKAIAGCPSDSVKGVPGVGEITAAKYLIGALGAHTKAYQNIEKHKALWYLNMGLVTLPFQGTPIVTCDHYPPRLKWHKVLAGLGMESLLERTNA